MRTFVNKRDPERIQASSAPACVPLALSRGLNTIGRLHRSIGNRAVQQRITSSIQIQRDDRELDPDQTQECLKKVEAAIKELEATAAKPDYPLPPYITTAIKLLRKKMTEGKIKCYAFSGIKHGRVKGDEIHIDGVTEGAINVTSLLHEGVHAEHQQQFPRAGKQYGENEGKEIKEGDPKLLPLLRWKAYTEYWAYRARFDYFNPSRAEANRESDEDMHAKTMKDPGVRVPMSQVRTYDPTFDPRVWKPAG